MEISIDNNQLKNSQGGPKTSVGKSISAMNSLKHGATAKHFLNDEEKTEYMNLCENLEKTYHPSSPLINIQIKRYARTHVFLERINNIIDAKFVLSQSDSKSIDSLQQRLNISESEMSILSKIYLGEIRQEDFNDMVEKEVFSELPYLAIQKKFKNQQEYLDKTPKFCKFLYEEAKEKKLSIKEYIDLVTENNTKADKTLPLCIKVVFVDPKDKIKDKEKEEESSLENSILNTALIDLQNAVDWFGSEYGKTFKTLAKFENFMDLLSIEKESSTPDLDELDKLMRYQTTLQRQLSTITGELIALTK